MRYYETLFIINPDLAEDEITAVVEKFTGILTDAGAMMVKVDPWGRRRLAYEVKKFTKGFYVLMEYGAEPAAVAEMERIFKIDEQVIRYLTVKKSDEFDAEEVAAQIEAQKVAAEQKANQPSEEDLESQDEDQDSDQSDDDDEDSDQSDQEDR